MPNNDPLSYALMGLGLSEDEALSTSKKLRGAGEQPKKSVDDLATEAVTKPRPLSLEIGPARILRSRPAPPIDLKIGPAKILPEPELKIGPARIHPAQMTKAQQEHLEGMTVQNAEAMTAAGMPSAALYSFYRGISRPQPSVADMASMERGATPEFRTLERRPTDVSMQDVDKFGNDTLERMYGEHLKAMQDNRDSRGYPTDRFPPGYFKGMSQATKENIKAGVEELMLRSRGTRT